MPTPSDHRMLSPISGKATRSPADRLWANVARWPSFADTVARVSAPCTSAESTIISNHEMNIAPSNPRPGSTPFCIAAGEVSPSRKKA